MRLLSWTRHNNPAQRHYSAAGGTPVGFSFLLGSTYPRLLLRGAPGSKGARAQPLNRKVRAAKARGGPLIDLLGLEVRRSLNRI